MTRDEQYLRCLRGIQLGDQVSFLYADDSRCARETVVAIDWHKSVGFFLVGATEATKFLPSWTQGLGPISATLIHPRIDAYPYRRWINSEFRILAVFKSQSLLPGA